MYIYIYMYRHACSLTLTERKITDHSRTVNKVCWHPQKVHNLLSASQDGTMRLWVRATIALVVYKPLTDAPHCRTFAIRTAR
jgi:WD40 repeat protein